MNRLETLLTLFMAPFQRLENAMVAVRDGRSVDTAVGAQLDVLGRIVGQPRLGLSDAAYRRYIRARIATNRATGKREDLLRIARLVLGDDAGTVVIRAEQTGSYILEIRGRATDAATATALVDFLGRATGVGIRIVVETSTVPLNQTYRFDLGPGLDVGHYAAGDDNVN